jgi:hypothetical protein
MYNKIIKSRKGLIFYYKTRGIMCLKNHVDLNHVILYKFFEEEVNSFLKGSVERQLVKKYPSISRPSIFNFIVAKNPYKQSDVEQQ